MFNYHRSLETQIYSLATLIVLGHNGGDEESRTPDPLLARQVLSQLSYTPTIIYKQNSVSSFELLRKEVIQPHLPIRLPCYDFTPVIGFTFDGRFLKG